MTAASAPTGPVRFLPGVAALRRATPRSVAHDLSAGLVLSALLVPAGMAYAQASGLPPVTGLYATMIPMLAYALVGPSRILVLGPDSSLTALVAAVVVPLSHGDPARAIALASLLSLIGGAMCVVAGLARFGFLTDLLSVPIRHGYLAGIAAIVIVGQLPRLCGFSTSADGLVDGLVTTVSALRDGRLNVPSLVVGLGGLAAVLLLRWWKAGFPGTLAVVIAATVAAVAFHLDRHGVALVGRVPQGLPRFTVPAVDRSEWGELLSAGFGIALVSFADSSVLSRTYAARGGYPVDPDQELVAIGLCNMASGLFQGFSVSASASRTPVAESAGARSQLTGVFGALTIAVLLIAAPTLFVHLPVAVLASIVVAAALRLVDIPALLLLYRARRSEVVLSAVAFLGVAFGGAIVGVGLAVVVSLLNFVRKAWRPHTAELVRVDGLKGYHDAERHPEGRRIPGLLLFRFDAPLFFANADEFRRRVVALSRRAEPPTRRVVVTAEPITDVDATSALMLAELDAELQTMGIQLAFAELKGHVRDALAPFGLVEGMGPHRFHRTVGEAVKSYLSEEGVSWVDWEDRHSTGAPTPHGPTLDP